MTTAGAGECATDAVEYMVHWQYTREEWRAFSAAQQARTGRTARLLPVWFGLAGLGGALIAGVTPAAAVAATLGLAVAGWLVGWAMMRHARSLGDAARPDSTISREAVVVAGRTTRIAGGGTKLEAMRLLDGAPRVLELSLRHGGRAERSYSMVRVPVPVGREAEAEQVLREFGFAQE